MRVTENMRLLEMLRASNATSTRLAEAQRRASAGAMVTKPSDDPIAYATMTRRDATLSDLAARTRTARDAADELQIAEGALDSSSTLMEEASSLAVQGANGTLSQTDRDALAMRVGGIRAQLLELANTRGSSGYVFAGTKTNAPPFDPSGAFVANDGVVRVPVTDGVEPRANASGAQAFTAAGGRDVFADLSALQTALSAGDTNGINAGIDALKAGHDQIVGQQVQAGLSIDQLQSAADVMDNATTSVSASRARAAGADDQAPILTELTAATTAYQQSLAITRSLLSIPTLASTTN